VGGQWPSSSSAEVGTSTTLAPIAFAFEYVGTEICSARRHEVETFSGLGRRLMRRISSTLGSSGTLLAWDIEEESFCRPRCIVLAWAVSTGV